MTPGLAYHRTDSDENGSATGFAEAMARRAPVDPSTVTGRTTGRRDVRDGGFAPFGGTR